MFPALQKLVLTVLLFAGLSFSTQVKYLIKYSEFKYAPGPGRYAIPPNTYYMLPATDTLVLVAMDYKTKQDPDDSTYMYLEGGINGSHTADFNNTSQTQIKGLCKIGYCYRVHSVVTVTVPPLTFSKPNNVYMQLPQSQPLSDTAGRIIKVYKNPISSNHTYKSTATSEFNLLERFVAGVQQPPDNAGEQFYIRRADGPADASACSTPDVNACTQCAWPYKAIPDTIGCGCKVLTGFYQSENMLAGQCNAYCNSTEINGLQSYLDWTRSNFKSDKGAIKCACSNQTGYKYRATGTCPKGTSAQSIDLGDTTLQPVKYDPKLTDATSVGSGGGSGNVTDTAAGRHLSSIDSILGNTTGWDKYHDSLKSYGNGVDSVMQDSVGIRDTIQKAQGDTSKSNYDWLNTGVSGGTSDGALAWGTPCYQCDTIPDTTIAYPLEGITLGKVKDSMKITIGTQGYATKYIDFYALFRSILYLGVLIGTFNTFIFIAGGTTGKDSV